MNLKCKWYLHEDQMFFDKLVLCFKHENWKGLMISIDVKDGRTRTAFLTYINLYYIAFIHIHLIYWWQTKYINCTVIYKANTMCWNLTNIDCRLKSRSMKVWSGLNSGFGSSTKPAIIDRILYVEYLTGSDFEFFQQI